MTSKLVHSAGCQDEVVAQGLRLVLLHQGLCILVAAGSSGSQPA